jgi:chromosome segregation ATPase
VSNLIDIAIIFINLNFKPKNFLNKKNWLLKKIFKKKTTFSFGKKLLFNNQLDFLEKRFKEVREKMIKNRKNYFIIFHKKKKMIFSKEKKFLNYFEDWSRLVRIIYKNISATYLNPFGGTIFLDYFSGQIHRKNRIIFSIVPNQKILKYNENLSEGERTLVVLSIFISFNYLNSPPLMILDEIDSHLDQLNLKKFIELFKKLEKKKGWSIIIISQRNSLSFYFSGFVGIYKSLKGSKIHLIKF